MEPRARLARMMQLDYGADADDNNDAFEPVAERAADAPITVPDMTTETARRAPRFLRPVRDDDLRRDDENALPPKEVLDARRAVFSTFPPPEATGAGDVPSLDDLDSIRRRRALRMDDPLALFSHVELQADRDREAALRAQPRYRFAEAAAGTYGRGSSLDLFLDVAEVERRAQDVKTLQLSIAESYRNRMAAAEQIGKRLDAASKKYEESTRLRTAVSVKYMPLILSPDTFDVVSTMLAKTRSAVSTDADPWPILMRLSGASKSKLQDIVQNLALMLYSDSPEPVPDVDVSSVDLVDALAAIQIIYCLDIFISDPPMKAAQASIVAQQWKQEMGWLFPSTFDVVFTDDVSIKKKSTDRSQFKKVLEPLLMHVNALLDEPRNEMLRILDAVVGTLGSGYTTATDTVPTVMARRPRDDASFVASVDVRGHAMSASAFVALNQPPLDENDRINTLTFGTKQISFYPSTTRARSWEASVPIRPPVAACLIVNYDGDAGHATKNVPKNLIRAKSLLMPPGAGAWPDANRSIKEMDMEKLRSATLALEDRMLRAADPYHDIQLSFDVIKDASMPSFYGFVTSQFDMGRPYYVNVEAVGSVGLNSEDADSVRRLARYIAVGVTVHDFATHIVDCKWKDTYTFTRSVDLYKTCKELIVTHRAHLRIDARFALLYLALGYALVREWTLFVLDVCSAHLLKDLNAARDAWSVAGDRAQNIDELRQYYANSYAESIRIAMREMAHPRHSGIIAYSMRFRVAVHKAWDFVVSHVRSMAGPHASRLTDRSLNYVLDSRDPKDETFRSYLAEVAARFLAEGDTIVPDARYVPKHQIDVVRMHLEDLRVRLVRPGNVYWHTLPPHGDLVPRM